MQKTTPQLLNDLLQALNEMSGAASIIIHHHQDMRWYFIRKILEEVQDATVKQCIDPLTKPKIEKFEKKTQVVV